MGQPRSRFIIAGGWDEAEAAYRETVRLKPDSADNQFGLAAISLTQGRYAEGWKQYEWRRMMKDCGPLRQFEKPIGKVKWRKIKRCSFSPSKVLAIRFSSCVFLEQVKKRVGRVVLEVQPSLRRLLRSFLNEDELIGRGDAIPPFDLYCPLMSLPHVMGITDESQFTPQPPYLKAEPALVAAWKEKLKGDGRKLIGLNWQGNPRAAVDKGRSLPLALLTPLLERDDLRFVVVQRNDGLEQIDALPSALRAKLEKPVDVCDGKADAFVDSAAIMACLDLFITTDTALSHLAGATNTPCITMLKFMPDWRWLDPARTTSPWYPNHTLIRQTQEDELGWGDSKTHGKTYLENMRLHFWCSESVLSS